MYVMLAFLEGNSISFEASDAEVTRVGLAVASGAMTYEQLRDWLIAHVD